MATATQERTRITFISRSRNLRVILKPRRNRLLQNVAGQVAATPPVPENELPEQPFIREYNERAEAEDLPTIDVEALPAYIDFKNWTHETDDPNVLLALRNHPNLNKRHAGFYESYPTAEERLAEVTRLTAARDVEALRALLEVERRQGNHANVLEAGEAALAALDTEPEPEGKGKGETAEAGSTDDSQEPPGESGKRA